MKHSLIAFLVCAAIVVGLSSPRSADALTTAAPSSPFVVTRSGDTYQAASRSTTSTYTGTLKFVVESAVGELEAGGGGVVEFAAGTFDLGSDYFRLVQVHNITFHGQGMNATLIQNWADAAADTEPFNFSGAFGVAIRDISVSAGGPVRLTSDALDFDEGNDSIVERVRITASRGRGIVFDGKNAGWTSANNIVRDCVIDGVVDSGIEFLASSNNLVEGCTITNTGRHGIEAGKASATAAQPNKKASNNTIRNNVIDNVGVDGVHISSSDANRIEGNRITNSSNGVAGADGIRIASTDSITCDDNVVEGNVATDSQATKTQRYGLNISSALCNRTVVGGTNDFAGNRVGPINDLGTATQYGTDTVAPTAPGNLRASAVYKNQIDLSWTASVDGGGVTAYEIWRDGSLIATIGTKTAYSDPAVGPGTTHAYGVRARDGAGNVSAFSDAATVTTPTTGALFYDGFETGDLSRWTSTNGLAIQQEDVRAGGWAARANAANTPGFAVKHLAYSEPDLVWQMHFKVLSQGTNANLMRFRTPTNGAILTVFVSSTNRIGYRNDVAGLATTSTTTAARGAWHTLQVHVSINGGAGQTEVWLDGTKIDALSKAEQLGTNPIGRLELGDSESTHTYDIVFDDVEYDRGVTTDSTAPTAPSNVVATPHSGLRVDLSWGASADGFGVTEYEVYRDGAPIGTVAGTATSYADATTVPHSSYAYTVRGKDAAGNVSPFSSAAAVTTGDAFADDFEAGNLSKWTTVSGVVAQQAIVHSGQWSARASSTGTTGSSARVQLDASVRELTYRARFRIEAQGSRSVTLVRFLTAQGGALSSAYLTSTGKLGYRNDTNGSTRSGANTITRQTWHLLQMRLLASGGSSQADVWLDGVKVISRTDSLPSELIGVLELGESTTGSGRSFDVAFDNVVVNPTFPADVTAPTAPASLTSTRVTASEVDLAWVRRPTTSPS